MCALKGILSKEGKNRALQLLAEVNLSDTKNMKIGALSGGMRQRVGIVQALLGEPKLLIWTNLLRGLTHMSVFVTEI